MEDSYYDYSWYEELFLLEDDRQSHLHNLSIPVVPFSNVSNNSTSFEDRDVPVSAKVMVGIIYVLTGVLCGFVNLVLVFSVVYYKKMQSVTNILIANLALSDFGLAVISLPFSLDYYIVHTRLWRHGEAACAAVNFMQMASLYVSTYSLVVITIDRYLVIIHPRLPRMRRKGFCAVAGLTWMTSALLAVPAALYSRVISYPSRDGSYCGQLWPVGQRASYRAYYIAVFVAEFALPVVAMWYCYLRILVKICKRRVPGQHTAAQTDQLARSRLRTVRMLILLTTIHMLCWAPYHVVSLIRDFYPDLLNSLLLNNTTMYIAEGLAMGNSMMNTILYIVINPNIRSYLKAAPRDFYRCCTNRKGVSVRRQFRLSSLSLGSLKGSKKRQMSAERA
ncbi:prokineticin receptor 1-like [Branchiostoma floridae]|uniref:Prokineticin receptor 1-like n=1 Tax=Branchiostoma floridae TaxID=7739 RepID=A0A9J7KX00_BRAFL|nr:prokineticin receptor 1-like [Branchiostoma floridae]